MGGPYYFGILLLVLVLPVRQGSPRMRTVLRTCLVTQRTLRSFPKKPEIKQPCIPEHILRIANKLWKSLTRVIVSVITVIAIFVPDVFEFDASSFQMLICPKHRDDFGIGWRCRKSCVKFPWLSHPIMSPREERKKGLSPSGRRKKPCLDYISELVGACSCASSNLS